MPHADDRPEPRGLELDVLRALALGAMPRYRTWLVSALEDPALRHAGSPRPSQDHVRQALASLRAAGRVVGDQPRSGQWTVIPSEAAARYAEVLDAVPVERLRAALARADDYPELTTSRFSHGLPTLEAAVARLRLEAFSGQPIERLVPLLERLPYGLSDDLSMLFDRVILDVADDALFDRLHPSLQGMELVRALARLEQVWRAGLPMSPANVVEHARGLLAGDERVLMRREHETLALTLLGQQLAAVAPSPDAAARFAETLALLPPASAEASMTPGWDALREVAAAAVRAATGDWPPIEAAVDAALPVLRKATGKRRGLLPTAFAELYALALLAQGGAARLEKALKFCLAEGGSREPNLDTGLGYLALALRMRLGETPLSPEPFARPRHGGWGTDNGGVRVSPLDYWRLMTRAWLKEGAQAEPLSATDQRTIAALREALSAADLRGHEARVAAAAQVLSGESPPAWFFVRGGVERWQAALQALAAIAEPAAGAPSAKGAAAEPESRLVWVLDTSADGRLLDIEVMEQKRGARGWGKPKEMPLARLKKAGATVLPRDATAIAALRSESYARTVRLDLAAAVAGLVGHPHVAFSGVPEVFVELVEGAASLDVVEDGDVLRVRIDPPLRVAPAEATPRWGTSAEQERELEALRAITVWRDGPQRARLVRLTPAQKRVAQLLGPAGLEIPRHGASQLQSVLASLGSHFQIHADAAIEAQAAREVPAETRLRAELQPVGPGLQVRLLAAPYGDAHAADGPRLVPGRGRARLVTTIGGETLGVQRDLARERANLLDVVDACPMLVELPPDAPCEWQLDAPEDALGLVERLHRHHAIAALDWPQGRPVRVEPAALDQLSLKVRTHTDWLAVDGDLKVDESLVVSLQQLLAFGADSRSRFVPLGEGRFLALTQELRERIDDLAAVAEAHAAKGGTLATLRVPTVAAPWLQAVAEGARVEYDAGYARQLRRLDEARRVVPALPRTLQASLRPYQEEGFEWAMRLAHAGLGGCLADDMGLGKTLQALAVLLARAKGGPALVVAPTSLMGNWRAEAARFAPSLRVTIYAEGGAPGERRAQVDAQGAHDVLLVSYPMLQIDAEAFAARAGGWHTLVLDEAQAIKNAGAKRSQAVFALVADFRLALSGTPIENRLAELWSIMRACNPGLLGTQARFNERFANLIERQHDRHAQRTLRRLVAPFLLRRTKAEVLADLPPRTELVLKVQPEEAERAHYEALRREALIAAEKSLSGDAAGQAHLNILAGLTRLRRAACDPRLVSPNLKLSGAKVAAFGELAQELVANGHKALVFSQFVDFLELLREPLDAAGIAYQTLDGRTPAAERTRRVDAFQAGEGDLFLISLKAGGFGLNLTVADYVVIADPWWNPAAEDQASGRAHRIGQQRPVTVYRLVAQGTLEERIVEMHQVKRELADSVLEAAEGDPSGASATALPGADELLALMRDDLQAREIFG